MSRHQERVLRLRKHVLSKEEEKSKLTERPSKHDSSTANAIVFDDVTKSDISQLLGDKGIEHNPRDTKRELYQLLLGSDRNV